MLMPIKYAVEYGNQMALPSQIDALIVLFIQAGRVRLRAAITIFAKSSPPVKDIGIPHVSEEMILGMPASKE